MIFQRKDGRVTVHYFLFHEKWLEHVTIHRHEVCTLEEWLEGIYEFEL